MLKAHLLVIDGQNDFMGEDNGSPYKFSLGNGEEFSATLPVAGAMSDMKRLAIMIDRVGPKLDDIHATMDSHQIMDVALKAWWKDNNNNLISPFMMISSNDLKTGVWQPRISSLRSRMVDYVEKLESKGNYPLMIWPDHCLIGTPGHNIYPPLMEAFNKWCAKNRASINYVTKGSNPYTEHYGAMEAEVSDPNDPSTQLNTRLIQVLQDADIVAIAGEASSHCVKSTIQQIVDNIGDTHLHKLHLITDCMSPVAQPPGGPDFPQIAAMFLKDMESRGLHLTKSTEFLA